MDNEKKQIIDLLTNHPVKIAHKIGFSKLKEGLHDKWIKKMLLCEGGEYTLEAHRGSYKTTCVSLCIAILMILKPYLTILFCRKTSGDAEEILKQVAKILKTEIFKALVFKLYGIKNFCLTVENSTQINTNLNVSVLGTVQLEAGGLGLNSGKHYDRVFSDDITNLQDRTSRAERERTCIFFQELRGNILNKDGDIVNTLTPWHKDDASKLMKNIDLYDVYSTGILSEDEIKQKENDMESSLFACCYLLKHIASAKVIFTSPKLDGKKENLKGGIQHLDAAYGGSDGTAYSIVNKKGDEYFVFGKLWQMPAVDLIAQIKEEQKIASGLSNLFLEDNGDKGLLAKEFRKNGVPTSTYHENRNKFNKITSILKPVWSHVHFVEGTDEEYINQICDFFEGVSHDDAPDSLSCAVDFCNKYITNYTPLWN